MSRVLLASLLPLAFVVGCGDPNSDGNGNGGNTECNHSDCDVTEFEAMIVATTPFEGVEVTVDGTDADCVGTSCTFAVTEADEYEVEAWDTYTFVPKTVDVVEEGEFQVSWATGGCASDAGWTADSACDEWIPGEYAFPPLEGSYTDENWGSEVEITIDLDGAVTILGVASSYDATMGDGNAFFGERDGNWVSGEVIDEETFSTFKTNAQTGGVDEFLFHRD